MPKLVVMLRVKDAISFVYDWLERYEKLVDEIVVLDNDSTDGTFEVLKSHPKVVDITKTEGYNEGRDKNILYSMLRKRKPDWCLWVDIDEIFEPEITRSDFDRLMNRRFVNKYGFRRFHFIDKEHFAGSGDYFKYTCFHDRIMWRESSKGYFENFILDSPNVQGIKGIKINTDFRLKHLGYMTKELVDRKAKTYKALIDPRDYFYLEKMYLNNEKKIKWHDNRKKLEVKKLNAQLNLIRFLCLVKKGLNKAARAVTDMYHKGKTLSTGTWSYNNKYP